MLYCNTWQCVYFHALPAPDASATCFASYCTAVPLCTVSEMGFYDICVLAPWGPITCSSISLGTLSLCRISAINVARLNHHSRKEQKIIMIKNLPWWK